MDIPDPEEWWRRLQSWEKVVKSAWKFLGFVGGGFALAIAAGLRTKPEILQIILGTQPLAFLDSSTIWLFLAVIGVVVSTRLCGKELFSRIALEQQAYRDIAAAVARDTSEKEASHVLNQKNNVTEIENLRQELLKVHAEKDVLFRENVALKVPVPRV